MNYSVGQVADLASVTVRTLHHYGQIGLLEPGSRSASGYRLYSDNDLQRLQHILFYRELGFSLDDIATILNDPGANAGAHLRRQRQLLIERINRLTAMVAAVDKEMEAYTMGIQLTPEEKFEIFGPNYSEDYEVEAQQRWGDTDAWRQSQQRTSKLTKQQWIEIREAGDDLNRRLAAAMARAPHRTARRRWISPRSTAGRSRRSTTAPPRCIATSATCTSRTSVSRARTTTWRRASRGGCGTRSTPTLIGRARRRAGSKLPLTCSRRRGPWPIRHRTTERPSRRRSTAGPAVMTVPPNRVPPSVPRSPRQNGSSNGSR